MIKKSVKNKEEKQIVSLTNGSKIEIQWWSKDKKFLSGKVIGSSFNTSIYIPVSYIWTNTIRPSKRKIIVM